MAIRPRSTGEILDGAFRLYVQDVGLYTATAIVASIPLALLMVVSLVSGGSTGALVVAIVLAPIAIAAVVSIWTSLLIQMNERLEGREPQLGPSVRRALALMLRVVWAGIIAYFFFAVAVLGWALVVGIMATVGGAVLPDLAAVSVVVIVGLALGVFVALAIVPGLFLFLPGIAVEDKSAYESVKRGFELAKGGRGRILVVLIVAWLLIAIPMLGVYLVTGTASMLVDPEAMSTGTVSAGQFILQQFLLLLVGGFTTPYIVACILLLYFDQRIRREAFDLQSEAEALAS
jgi:hypothetical protein